MAKRKGPPDEAAGGQSVENRKPPSVKRRFESGSSPTKHLNNKPNKKPKPPQKKKQKKKKKRTTRSEFHNPKNSWKGVGKSLDGVSSFDNDAKSWKHHRRMEKWTRGNALVKRTQEGRKRYSSCPLIKKKQRPPLRAEGKANIRKAGKKFSTDEM